MQKLPGFDVKYYPFVVCVGSDAIKLLNVNDDYIEPLVICESSCKLSQ